MELKTKLHAEDNKQELLVTREFDLPVELLFRAYTDPEILEQWMGSKVVKLENRKHGGWEMEKKDNQGNVLFQANGVIHEFIPNERITRTFEMANVPYGVQLEFFEFEKLTEDTSKLKMHILYRSVEDRNQMMQIGMPQGMNAAHNYLERVVSRYK
ncbi:MAG TPA: SRPBCC domain-containing protein [Pseudobacter sp.]|nr:SRPBCC domain-containing protein [Pseudobacter sp.]